MARKKDHLPSYLLHPQSGQARVRIGGRDILLSLFGSDESRIKYAEVIANHSPAVAWRLDTESVTAG
ncbi:MAG: hypothetical protein WCJ09_07560 [Planctomycetota bacterium]